MHNHLRWQLCWQCKIHEKSQVSHVTGLSLLLKRTFYKSCFIQATDHLDWIFNSLVRTVLLFPMKYGIQFVFKMQDKTFLGHLLHHNNPTFYRTVFKRKHAIFIQKQRDFCTESSSSIWLVFSLEMLRRVKEHQKQLPFNPVCRKCLSVRVSFLNILQC